MRSHTLECTNPWACCLPGGPVPGIGQSQERPLEYRIHTSSLLCAAPERLPTPPEFRLDGVVICMWHSVCGQGRRMPICGSILVEDGASCIRITLEFPDGGGRRTDLD